MHDDDPNSTPGGPDGRGPRPVGPDGGFGRGQGARRRPATGGFGTANRRITIIAALALIVLVFGSGLIAFWTDAIWYRSVGFDGVFWTRVGASFGLFAAIAVGTLVILLVNLWLANRFAPRGEGTPGTFGDLFTRLSQASVGSPFDQGNRPGGPRPINLNIDPIAIPDLAPVAVAILAGLSILGALIVGGAAGAHWETVLLWVHRVPFVAAAGAPSVDPIFGRNISWFMFDLPFLRTIQSLFNALVVGSLLVAGGRYLAAVPQTGMTLPSRVRVHLAILAGLFLVSIAFGYQLDKYELVYASRTAIWTGVSYTDQNAQFFAYDLLTGLSAFAAAFLVGAAFTRWTWPLGVTVATWFLASLFVGRLYPEVIQRLVVQPNQYNLEQVYIANNISMTRLAFGIDTWDERAYDGSAPLTPAAVDAEAATFKNARLWDYRPLADTLDQLQTVRRYYDFTDVDTDRYILDDHERQVMLSARELNLANNQAASGWVNQRIIYTHGIGLAMVPVNEVTAEGQPVLLVKNLPPASSGGAPPITEPRIYFGEAPSDYVVVGARGAEFDYPQGDANGGETGVQTRWSGTTGIRLDTTLSRLLYALRFRDLNLFISDQVTADSQLLMYRTLNERLQLIAPFLQYDKDPYLVVTTGGRLVYIQDAYTTTARFPNAEPFNPADLTSSGLAPDNINYIRNSVKVVMDAYDGTMSFYVADPTDPLIQAWSGVFPTLFKPLSAMPADLRAHLRVPEDLFNIQTAVYGRYHVTNTETFYRSADRWTVPAGQTNQQSLPSEAYYVVMRMPGEAKEEFLLLQPMVPSGRPNMIAWVAARNDQPNYGGTRVYRFPTDTSVFGPAQIEARIDQDPTISAQITLWNQSGSKVVRGNLIVVPIGDTLMYLQPVYLQSTSSSFPEFQRIVVASPTTVVWGRTLSEALGLILNTGGPTPTPTPTPGGSPGPSPSATPIPTAGAGLPADVTGLIAYANAHFEAAQAALRNGDFAAYGREIELVRQALARLDQLAGPSISPAP